MGIEKSRPVLITGCSTGIGRATAERLADDGWNVHATARRPESIEDLQSEAARHLPSTSPTRARWRRPSRRSRRTARSAPWSTTPATARAARSRRSRWTSVRRQFETNVFGLMRMCQLVLPGMRGAGSGRIVNLSSMGGKLTFPGGGVYHATKHAVEALSDALRFEVTGVRHRRGGDRAGADRHRVRRDRRRQPGRGRRARALREVQRGRRQGDRRTPTRARWRSFGAGPEAVAAKISKALTARRPSTRYKVTPSARVVMGMRAADDRPDVGPLRPLAVPAAEARGLTEDAA